MLSIGGINMITITNPEKYIAGLYERLSDQKIEVADGVIINNEDERESRKHKHTENI